MKIDAIAKIFQTQFTTVPEVQNAIIDSNRDYKKLFAKLFSSYTELLKNISTLPSEDIEKITKIHGSFKKYIVAGGIEEPGAHTFLSILGEKRKHFLSEAGREIANPSSGTFKNGLADLVKMMAKASELKKQGKSFVDSDAGSDTVIWTHTKITDSTAILHVAIAHFFERALFRFLREKDASLIFPKDYYLNVLDDVIILQYIRTPGNAVVFDEWNKQKEDGGLGWINPEKVKAYEREFGK